MKAPVVGAVVSAVAALLLCACAPIPTQPEPAPPAPPPPPTPDQQFEALAQRYLRESPEQSPVGATALGDHRFDDRLDEVSADAWKARLTFTELYLASLEPLDRTKLSRPNQVDALLLRPFLFNGRSHHAAPCRFDKVRIKKRIFVARQPGDARGIAYLP